jgi:D-glutamate cyclase
MALEEIKNVGEILDRLLSVPIYTGSSLTKSPVLLELYESARSKFKEPLTYLAVNEILGRVKKGDTVLIATGFVVPPWLRPEHDGPAGAVTLARALNLSLDVTPVIVAEKVVNEKTISLCKACGFEVTSYDEAKKYPRRIALENLSLIDDIAKERAKTLLDEMQPSLILTIEKSSPNEKGVYHSGVGYDITAIEGKIQYLIEEAKRRNIFTIGIGDGGNEVGMGCIKETVKRVVPTGAHCGCPCGAGTHSDIATDLLIVAMVSNWGAYALEALLAIAKNKPEIMHDRALEERVFEAAISAGLIDPAAGFSMASGDAIDANIHLAIVDILNFIVKSKISDNFYMEKYKEYLSTGREAVQEKVKTWAIKIQEED